VKRIMVDVIANVEEFAQNLYARACANERSGLVGAMLTSVQLETGDAKQLAQDITDIVLTLRDLAGRGRK
jgi:hypothetical protein